MENFLHLEPVTLKDLQRELSNLKDRMERSEDKIEQTATKLESLEETVVEDRAKTMLLLADHCERLDQQSNIAKSHCVLITGSLVLRL
jgi:hypothetical protein